MAAPRPNESPATPAFEPSFTARIDEVLRGATGGAWSVARVGRAGDAIAIELATNTDPLSIRVFPVTPNGRWYQRHGELAFSYQTPDRRQLTDSERPLLDRSIAALVRIAELDAHVRTALSVASPSAVAAPPPPPVRAAPKIDAPPFPNAEAQRHLESSYSLPPGAIETFRRDGFVVLKGVLDPAVVAAARPWIVAELERNWPSDETSDRKIDGYRKAFVQITNVGRNSPAVRAFTHARRLGRIAAELLGVRGMRLYCEDWLLKEPGEGSTGWHTDSCVFPFDAEASCTAWIPLQPVTPEMGLLRLAKGTHTQDFPSAENITDDGDAEYARLLEERGIELVTVPPFELGDVSFHDARLIHGATPNRSAMRRDVLALHMFSDGARVKPPTTRTMQHQLAQFGEGRRPGELADSSWWPLLHRDEGAR